MEKRYTILLSIAAFLFLSALFAFFIIYSDSEETCTSVECVKTANELLTHLDPSVAPCNDFYEFTCGKFIKTRNENESNELSEYIRNVKMNQMKFMLEGMENPLDTKGLQLGKAFYKACMNESAIEKAGLKQIREVLRSIGGWPTLERGNWRENRFDWMTSVREMRKIGIDFTSFIHFNIGVNKLDPTKHVLNIFPGVKEDVRNDSNFYQEYMVDIAVNLGCDKNRAERECKEVIEFENQLRKLTASHNTRDIKYASLYNPRTLSQVQYEFPTIPWVDFINEVLYPSATLTSDDVVNLLDSQYIREFFKLLERTPTRIVANFISWKVIQYYLPYLPKQLRKIQENYEQRSETYKYPQRTDICLDTTLQRLPHAMEASYVRKYISDDAKRFTKDIIDYIKKEFNKILDDLDWLDLDAKEVAREKLASTKDYIAHTQEAPRLRKLVEIYNEIPIHVDPDLLKFLQELDLMNLNLKYQKLIEPVYEDNKGVLMYSVKENTLVLPSYYLQGLFFNENRPQYMNYGAIGTIIAYQLSKLFLEGRRYDLYGNFREYSTSQSLFNYNTKAKCISEQYKEFYIPGFGRNMNSSSTQEDDVATHFGRKIAYEAYHRWAETHDNEQRLPGLTYTPKQLFWISSALFECSKRNNNPEEVSYRSPAKARVLGTLRNNDDFSKDFSCSKDSFMNPSEKCQLW